MATTTYYISYGKPPRPSLWRYVLLALLFLLAVALAAGIAYGIYELASGGNSPAASEGSDDFYLPEALAVLYESAVPGNAYIIPDSVNDDDALARDLPSIPGAFLKLDAPKGDSGRVLLVNDPRDLPDLGDGSPVGDAVAEAAWLKGVQELVAHQNSPDYIYDKVAAAHEELVLLDDRDNDNTIILVTDGLDGGYAIFDAESVDLCPAETEADAGAVCGPILETAVTTFDQLVACPPDIPVAPDFVCILNPDAGNALPPYIPVHPEKNLERCPPALDGPDAVCYDRVVDYVPVNLDNLACPPELGAPPGKACAELYSETTETELLAMIDDSPVHNLRVNVIGLGNRADHRFLQLLAETGNGEYIYCSARGCDRP